MVYYQYSQAKGDKRSKEEMYRRPEKIKEREARGVDIATGHGEELSDLNPELEARVIALYEDAKACLKAELTPALVKTHSPYSAR